MLKKEVLLKKILESIILVIVIPVIIPIVLLSLLTIWIIDSITSSRGLYLVRRSLNTKIRQFVPKKLNDAIFKNGVKSINILLDEDAQQEALRYTMQFGNQGITTKNIKPTDKDASDMGFTEVNNKLKESKKTGFGDIISQKLKGV
jgi:hypothetical protein